MIRAGDEVRLRRTYPVQLRDQAANLSEVLAWSFSLKSGHRPARTLRVHPERILTHGFASDRFYLSEVSICYYILLAVV